MGLYVHFVDVGHRGFNPLLGQYSSPADIARNIAIFREAGAGYLLLNGGGSVGGERGRQSLRRLAREVMPAFAMI